MNVLRRTLPTSTFAASAKTRNLRTRCLVCGSDDFQVRSRKLSLVPLCQQSVGNRHGPFSNQVAPGSRRRYIRVPSCDERLCDRLHRRLLSSDRGTRTSDGRPIAAALTRGPGIIEPVPVCRHCGHVGAASASAIWKPKAATQPQPNLVAGLSLLRPRSPVAALTPAIAKGATSGTRLAQAEEA